MTQTSRIPYHQNVYDLLGRGPAVCPDAARTIAEHEAAHGPLPAAMREWYLFPDMVHPDELLAADTLWHAYSNEDWPVSLAEVLRQFADPQRGPASGWVWVIDENQGVKSWHVEVNGSDDPPVWDDNGGSQDREEWRRVADTFSEFVATWFSQFYHWQSGLRHRRGRSPTRPYHNGLWLRTPAEPFEPAVIDYLTDHLGEPERTPRPGNVTTYTFRPQGGTIRVTADEPALAGGLSAWWVHADTPERLAELGRHIVPFGTLRDTLRADTDPGREVLRGIRGEKSPTVA